MSCPISWLTLELLHVEELASDEAADARRHLRSCARCADRLALIRNDHRPMPPLPSSEAPDLRVGWPLAIAVALAAAALLWVWTPFPPAPEAAPRSRVAVKGGVLALSAMRERGEAVEEEALGYRDGDRFKVLLTCPEGEHDWQLVAFDGGAAGVSLGSGQLTCGNRVALPGSVAPTGMAEVALCVTLRPGAAPVESPGDLGEEAACLWLWPEQ
ncbi:MAG: hypothetical protein KTR31_41065 [Myxococcales bacterium]|nr:hypothetical protein [Myxococcales bacterium]